MNYKNEQVTEKAVGSIKWSALIEAVSRTAIPITILILAHFLSPEDFGIVAIVMIIISFSQMFWDAGLSKTLIQVKEALGEAANVVFWTNFFLGVVSYCLLFIFSPWIAAFFNSPDSVNVLRVLGIQIIIASLSSVQQSLFTRNLDFRVLFLIRITTAFIPALVSIPLALLNYGVWALVCGSLAGQLGNLILLWIKSTWRPNWKFKKEILKPIYIFGLWVTGESLASWFLLWGDNLVVGKFLGVYDLGVYRTGWMFVITIFGLTLNPFLPLLYPTFSNIRDNREFLINTFHNVNRLVLALALPIGVCLLFTGSEVSELFFGTQWKGLGFVISVIGLQQGMAWLVSINTEVYRAIGRPDINTKLLFFSACFFLPAYIISIQFGMNVFLFTRLAVTIPGILIHVYILNRFLGVSKYYLWHEGNKILLALFSLLIILGGMKIGFLYSPGEISVLTKLALMIIIGMSVYTGCLWFVDRRFIMQIRNLLKRVLVT